MGNSAKTVCFGSRTQRKRLLDPTAFPTETRAAFHNAPLINADNVEDFNGEVNCAVYEDAFARDNIWSRVLGPDIYE